MKAAVLHGQRDIRVEEIPTPVPGPGEALVRVRLTGVCGSDIPRVLSDGAHFYPLVLGHEIAGEVAAVGEGVDAALVGKRVAVAPLLPCHECEHCRLGHYSQCPNYSFIGSRVNGGLAEFLVAPVLNLTVVADTVPFRDVAFFEPSTVALHGVRHVGFTAGQDVIVLGAGTIGLFTMQWVRILGAARVAVVDVNPARLATAAALGADATFDSTDAGFLAAVRDWQGGTGFGHVFETAGQNATMSLAFQLAAPHAGVCFIGTSHADLRFDHATFELMNRKEFRLTGSWMSYSAPFPGPEWSLTAECVADGRLRITDELVHGIFPLEEVMTAFELFEQPGAVTGKLLFA
ncbi:MAG: galactitol-1-phosphate 5-dehydrogenase, partial [Propionibacteriaceae bacterium]|nr:galactitol-1-phosphate 5-dehydrogenase [Propionibacteriaceae bacterium]